MNNLKQIKRAIKENPNGVFGKRYYESGSKRGYEYEYRLPKQSSSFSINTSTAKSLEKKGIKFKEVKHFRDLF